MNKNFAFVFPGQGSQSVGMLSELAAHSRIAEDTFHEASHILDFDFWRLTQAGPEELLNQTEYTQPALLAAGVAVWRLWQDLEGPTPSFMAGHSLGEYSALVCAGAMDFRTGLELVHARGKFMQGAVPPGEGAMAAIIGLDDDIVSQLCAEISQAEEVVAPANYNSVGQVVIAGHAAAVAKALILAKEKGAKIAKQLPVSVPSHSVLMKPAAIQLREVLKDVQFKAPFIPVINNVDVTSYLLPEQIKDGLIRQLESPVRWVELIRYMVNKGVQIIIESGPGKVLSGLNKRIDSSIVALSLNQPSNFHEALSQLQDLSLIGE